MSRKKKPKKPLRRRRPQGGGDSAVQNDDNYSSFGELGPKFQGAFLELWQAAGKKWKSQRRTEAALSAMPASYSSAFGQVASMAEYFMTMFVLAAENVKPGRYESPREVRRRHRAALIREWDSTIRKVFQPNLPPAAELIGDSAADTRRRKVLCWYSYAVMKHNKTSLQTCCYGPFSRLEMEYVTAEHPRIVEGACGSGYTIQEFRRRGIDAHGFDSNLYDLSDGQRCPWTQELIDQNLLFVGDQSEMPDDVFENRTLLISWPVSLTPFAAEILQRYTDLGGQAVLIKFGGFMQYKSLTSEEVVFRFFKILHQHWRQGAHPKLPGWRPQKVENNLLLFERL